MDLTMDMTILSGMLVENYARFSSLLARVSEKKMLALLAEKHHSLSQL